MASVWTTLSQDMRRLEPNGRGPKAAFRALLNPRFHPVALCRMAQLCRGPWLRPLGLAIATTNMLVYSVEIALDTTIGPGLFIPHGNVIIGAHSIGENFTAFSGVVIGSSAGNIADPARPVGLDRPRIGSNVTLYANSVVVGPVEIGDHVRVAAGVLVAESIPARSTVRPASYAVHKSGEEKPC
jgi:serine O-acetyltransferase